MSATIMFLLMFCATGAVTAMIARSVGGDGAKKVAVWGCVMLTLLLVYVGIPILCSLSGPG